MDHAGSPTSHSELSRRAAALRALAGRRDLASGGPRAARAVGDALRVFGSERELVLAAHQRWQVHLLARLDEALEQGADDAHDAVLRAVDDLGRAMPGLAALLSEHEHDPVLDRANGRLAYYVGRACSCGRPHPLVIAPVAPNRKPARCAVLRARTAGAGWAHWLGRLVKQHCGDRPPSASWQYS